MVLVCHESPAEWGKSSSSSVEPLQGRENDSLHATHITKCSHSSCMYRYLSVVYLCRGKTLKHSTGLGWFRMVQVSNINCSIKDMCKHRIGFGTWNFPCSHRNRSSTWPQRRPFQVGIHQRNNDGTNKPLFWMVFGRNICKHSPRFQDDQSQGCLRL